MKELIDEIKDLVEPHPLPNAFAVTVNGETLRDILKYLLACESLRESAEMACKKCEIEGFVPARIGEIRRALDELNKLGA